MGPPGPPGHIVTMQSRRSSTKGLLFGDDSSVTKRFGKLESEKPTGVQANPALTCATLFKDYPSKPTGNYFINPIGDKTLGSVQVKCDRATMSTCVAAKRSSVPLSTLSGQAWLQKQQQFDYAIDAELLNFLKLQSNKATQEIVLKCPSRSQVNASQSSGLAKLLADDDSILSTNARSKRLRFTPSVDGCRQMTGDQSVVIVSGSSSLLPIRDAQLDAVTSFSGSLELGQVCFS